MKDFYLASEIRYLQVVNNNCALSSRSKFIFKVSHIDERTFDKNVWVEIHKGNQFEMDFGKDAKANLDLTKYNAASRMLDIESFHTFIHYLIARGPGGDHDGKVWDTRQKHWRETVQINKK